MGFRHRLRLLFVFACLGAAIIWIRVLHLQVVEGGQWEAAAVEKRTWTRHLPAPRGRIRDASGRIVARDRPVPQLAFVGAEWTRRSRLRCTACNAIHFFDPMASRRARLERCRCKHEDSRLEPLPDGDLRPLEEALGLREGRLAELASARLRHVEKLVGEHRGRLERRGEPDFLLEDSVKQRRRDLLHRRFVLLRNSEVNADALRLLALDEEGEYRGFHVRYIRQREYPSPGPPGQLLGYVSAIASGEEYARLQKRFGEHVTLDTRIGRMGLERAYEDLLLGKKGEEILARGDAGAFTEVVSERAPETGKELTLTLTTEACEQARQAMARHATRESYFPVAQPSGGMILMEADTGRVLAWAELPHLVVSRDLPRLFDRSEAEARFNPNEGQWMPSEEYGPEDGETLEAWRDRISKPAPRHLSRVCQIAVEPGSTMKVFIGLGLLEGLQHMDGGAALPLGGVHGHFDCMRHPHFKPGCHRHGPVGFLQAVAYSCNRYFAISLRSNPRYWETYRRSIPQLLQGFGFGQPTGVDIWGERPGRFLRDYVDFEVHDPLKRVVAAVKKAGGPKVTLRLMPGVPRRVAGRDPARLERVLTRVLLEGGRRLGAKEALVRVERSGGEKRSVELDLLLAFRTHPDGPATTPEDRATFVRAAKEIVGQIGVRLSDEPPAIPGARTIAFRVEYHEPIGRKIGEPLVILRDDGRNVAIGQGPIAATPLQMVRAVAAIANGGRLVTPRVVDAADGVPVRTGALDLELDQDDLALVREGMRGAVSLPGGTAYNAGFQRVRAEVYGKTGTAQPGGWWRPYGSAGNDFWHHWFIGFAQARGRPAVAFACVLHARREEAAGKTAALAVADFLQWWFAAGPDER